MELLRDFKAINKHDAALAGGKGASLGEMTSAGIPVSNSERFKVQLQKT